MENCGQRKDNLIPPILFWLNLFSFVLTIMTAPFTKKKSTMNLPLELICKS